MRRNKCLFLGPNLKRLRNRENLSQEELAGKLNMTRSKINALEISQTKNPSLDDLFSLSEFFHLSIDTLLKVDITKVSELKLRSMQTDNDPLLGGMAIRVLALTTDKDGNENVEYVPVKAKAGYMAGFNDSEFINSLPKLQLPNLPKNKTFRMFPITGDSMLPFAEGDCIITEYVQDWLELHDEALCILILKGEQDFIFKKVNNQLKSQKKLVAVSLNETYKPYDVAATDILEIWRYHSHWSSQMPMISSLDDIAQKVNLMFQYFKNGRLATS